MELTLAEEIRALLEMWEKYPNSNRTVGTFLDAFPSLAAKMLAVIDERDDLRNRWVLTNRQAIEELTDTQNNALKRQSARIAELEKECVQTSGFSAAASRIAALKENVVFWETHYRSLVDELVTMRRDRDRLRWEASLLKEQPRC